MKENEELTIKAANLKAAYDVADDNTRKVLEVLFGNKVSTTAPEEPTPTLADYTTIRTYEDACIVLGIEPVLNHPLVIADVWLDKDVMELPPHIVELMKKEVIAKAYNKCKNKPKATIFVFGLEATAK